METATPLRIPHLRGSQIGACRDTLPARSGYGRVCPYFRCRCLVRSLGSGQGPRLLRLGVWGCWRGGCRGRFLDVAGGLGRSGSRPGASGLLWCVIPFRAGLPPTAASSSQSPLCSASACGESSTHSLAPPLPTKPEGRLCGGPMGRLPPTASSASAEAAPTGTSAPKGGAAPAEATAGTSPAEGGPTAAEAAAKAAAGAGLGPGSRRPSAPEGAAGPPAGRGPAAPKGAAEGTARPCARTWPGAGAGRWPGSEAHPRAEAGAPGRAGGPGGAGTEDKEGTVYIAGPVPAAAVTAAAGALQSQQHHDHQHKNNNQVGQIAHGRASFPGQRYCFPYQSSRALVSSSTASS